MPGTYRVVIEQGPDAGTSAAIPEGRIQIGRSPRNDLVLSDPYVSRFHIVVTRSGDRVTMTLQPHAHNPVYVNGEAVEEAELSPADTVRIGETLLTVETGAEETPARAEEPRIVVGEDPAGSQFAPSASLSAIDRPTSILPRGAGPDWRFNSLVEIGRTIANAVNRDALIEATFARVFEVLKPDRAVVAECVEARDRTARGFRALGVRTRRGTPGSIRMSRSVLEWMAETQRAAIYSAADHEDLPFTRTFTELGISDFLCAPYFLEDRLAGIFYFDLLGENRTPFTAEDLEFVVGVIQLFSQQLENLRLREALEIEHEELRTSFAERESIIGSSPAMQNLFMHIEKIALSDIPVLVLGETGAGKELVARSIHRRSGRQQGPFVALNCAAIPESLVEAELFGHEEGAFTGTARLRRGKIELAHTGTFFLDEIGEVPPPLQAKLLRGLESGEFYRVGGETTIQVDVRLIAATHKDPEALVKDGTFREDLYYRLAGCSLRVPPLRERGGDAVAIARTFLEKSGTGKRLSRQAERLIERYAWPGNVRELRNAIDRAIVFSSGRTISGDDLGIAQRAASDLDLRLPTLRENERSYVRWVLEKTEWNVSKAAKVMGAARDTVYKKIQEYQLKKEG